MITPADAFITAQTICVEPPFVPEITLYLATEITPIWSATEAWLLRHNIDPPYWAFAWAGGQALARYVLDNPAVVAGRRVLDFGAGCGIAAIACAMAGAARVEAVDIDPLATAAIGLNARRNNVNVDVTADDIVGSDCRWDLIVCGDVCYEARMTDHIRPWLQILARQADTWIADPGRAYLPTPCLQAFFQCTVPTSREIEDKTSRLVTLYRMDAA